MTQLEYAKNNIVTPLVKMVACLEDINHKLLSRHIKDGKIVIPLNKKHRLKKPCGIGYGLRTKVNANIGTSTDRVQIIDELKKLEVAIKYGADTIMDLSVGGDLNKILNRKPKKIIMIEVDEIAIEEAKRRLKSMNSKGIEIVFIKATSGETHVFKLYAKFFNNNKNSSYLFFSLFEYSFNTPIKKISIFTNF